MVGTVLVVGGDSTLGEACGHAFAKVGFNVLSSTRRRALAGPARPFIDLAQSPDTWALPPADICVLSAAVTSLAECQAEPASTARVNVDATVDIARRMAGEGAFVLLLSTNQVFDGTRPLPRSGDQPSPQSEYGRQKVAAENAILALGSSATLRLTKVLSPRMPLITRWLEELRRGAAIEAFSDMHLAPLNLDKAADAILTICGGRARGIFHASGDVDLTYVDLAHALARAFGKSTQAIKTALAKGRLAPELVPQHTALDCRSLIDLGWRPESSSAAIARFAGGLTPSDGRD